MRPPFPPRYTFVDHAADELAARTAGYVGLFVFAGWLGLICVACVLGAGLSDALLGFAVIMIPVDCLLFWIAFRERRKVARDPIPRSFVRPWRRGITTDRQTWFLLAPLALLVLLNALALPAGGSVAGFAVSALMFAVLASSFLPGVRLRARRHDLLALTIATNPVAREQWAAVEAQYPADAPYPLR